ncbi:MAG: hydrolase of the superfamily (permuted catalytic motifs)-like protein [Bryobacterales bacterium]|nr:hydrolase of the superfamily (permuted catalytic motifs)-like protein [Bryobacterales bacterium]
MAVQILLQGRLAGTEDFLLAAPSKFDNRAFEARQQWITLLGETLPRALLAHLQLPPLLLGSAGGGRFLVILPDAERAAEGSAFLQRVNEILRTATGGLIQIVWSSTENLGDWTVVRKRLADGLREQTTAEVSNPGYFDPLPSQTSPADVIPRGLRDATSVGWSLEFPALIQVEGGEYRWDLSRQAGVENIALPRHAARNGEAVASSRELAKRAKGTKLWGILRGEVDGFQNRLRRATGVEEHVQLSLLFLHFMSGEIELLCSQPEYFQKVTVMRVGLADFALCGAWDALASFARDLQRVFAVFATDHLKELPGAEAKSVTMSLTLGEPADAMAAIWETSSRDLEIAKAADKDCFYILGRVLEWKQLKNAAELRETVTQLAEDFRGGADFLQQLRSLYRKVEAAALNPGAVEQDRLTARALRFQRRFAKVGTKREREFQKLRSHLMQEMAGRNLRGRLRLRPEGLVALEWARLAED